LASAIPSLAASESKKSPVVAQTSAVEHTEARIKELRGVLKITDAQAKPWDTLTLVMRENAKEMDALTKDRAENAKPLNAVEEMKFHSQITETRLNQMKKFIPLFEELYASMSDEQKKNADAVFQKGIMRTHKIK
jgi:Mg-chelatase subunit ChlI